MKRNAVRVVEKPWGREVWLVVEREYAGKLLEVKKGNRLSLQYHKRKKESMFVLEGRAVLTVGRRNLPISEGDCVTIKPGEVHRITALSDVRIVEVSTPHVKDVVRLEDDYDR
jgi:mannose-6-phosphate isomerase-like protein (cupin superfamily)